MSNISEIPVKEIMAEAKDGLAEQNIVTPAVQEGGDAELDQTAEQAVENPAVTKKVLVIDDELMGLKNSHLPKNVRDLFADLTSPEVAELWEMAIALHGFKPLAESDLDKVRDYFASDNIVQDVILTNHFEQNCSPELRKSLSAFIGTAASVFKLKGFIHAAFPAPEYEVEFTDTRPVPSSVLLDRDLIIFDLMLEKSVALVNEVVGYLKSLGEQSYPAALPCIIIMSSRHDLETERMRFSHESNISAAGLLLLPKSEALRDEFGAAGLSLSYHQLERQREVAQKMRVFMQTWTAALEEAKDKASRTMWNLDAAAMQELHHVAFNDHDPYDEYLNALMMREYLWHVEAVPDVAKAVDSLDSLFQAQFVDSSASPVTIKQRFIAPFVKPENGRELVQHFTWTGFPLPPSLCAMDNDKAVKGFGKAVPFGALLAPKDLTSTTECLIHITQQCDLNQANEKQSERSVQFTVVLPTEVKDNKIPIYKNEDLVARGLHHNGKEYDFVLAKSRQIALPIPDFVDYAKRKGLNVIGRLRHDIATHFLLATANHMTRWASQKISHVEVRAVNLYLHGAKFPKGSVSYGGGVAQISFHVVQSSKLWYFQDDTSMHVALWINAQLSEYYNEKEFDIAKLCNQLTVGTSNKGCLMKFIHLHVEPIKPENLKDRLSEARAQALKDKVSLVAVYAEE